MTEHLPPWTSVAMPHDDVRDEQAVKAEYAINIGKIDREDPHVPRHYADPKAFFETTYLTTDLHRLLADTMAALCGKRVDRVLQLRTPFGGGKSHTLAALFHLARSRKELAKLPELKGIPDPGAVRVAVLPCADLTPGMPRKIKGGPTLHTLWGELAFRLGGAEGYDVVKAIDTTPSAPGGVAIEALLKAPKNQSTLILADEVLIYVEKALAVKTGESTLGRQTLAFLQHFTESVAGDPKTAFVYSLQASVAEAVGDEGLLQALDKLVGRVDARRVPVQDRQVREIVRRRLFKSLGKDSAREEIAAAYGEEFRRFALASAETKADKARVDEETNQFVQDIRDSYPFHPNLIRLMYERWGSLPSYQRTRGALQFLGTVVHVLFKRGHGGLLIAPGDIPLDDPDVRSEFFRQVGEREKWDSVLDADVAGDRARAKRVDRKIGEASPALMQARTGSTTATTVTLYSFGTRKDEMRGVPRADIIAASLRPGVEAPCIDTALGELREALLYLHIAGGRYRMDTIPSLTKLIEEAVAGVDVDDVARRVRETLETLLGNDPTAILWPDQAGRVPDERREFLMAYLPLEWAENTMEDTETDARALLLAKSGGDKGGKRKFRNGVGFVLPQKTYADQARALARRVIALESLRRKAKAKQLQVSEEQKEELDEKFENAVKDLNGACRAIYAHVLVPTRGKDGGEVIAFRSVELGTLAASADNLHGRLMDLLKKQIYTEMTMDRFVDVVGLNVKGSPQFVSVGEALDGFFSFLDHPKMRSEAPLLAALSGAVAARRLGYVPLAKVKGDTLIVDPETKVRFGTNHGAEEFSDEDGAYLLAPALAEKFAAAQKPPEPPPEPPVDGGDSKGEDDRNKPERPLPPPVAKGAKGKRYVIHATSRGKQAWYKLAGAINELVGMADASADAVVVTVEAQACQPNGFNPVDLRNKVQEPLDENDVENKVALTDK